MYMYTYIKNHFAITLPLALPQFSARDLNSRAAELIFQAERSLLDDQDR